MEKPPFILFADDDEGTLNLFRCYIDSFGWSADYVKTADEIIRKVNEHCAADGRCYDALVCSVSYFEGSAAGGPGLSGVAAARVIRENHPDLPVVFITNYASYFIKDEIHKVGAEYFEKPLDTERLFERLSYLINWHWASKVPPQIQCDRRTQSINRSGHCRRRSDRIVRVSEVLQTAINEIRDDRRLIEKRFGH